MAKSKQEREKISKIVGHTRKIEKKTGNRMRKHPSKAVELPPIPPIFSSACLGRFDTPS